MDDIIFAKIILRKKVRQLLRRNEKFDCDIIINEKRFSNSMTLTKENSVIYIFKKNLQI